MSKKITNILVGNVGSAFNEWQTALATLKAYELLKTDAETEHTLSNTIMEDSGNNSSDHNGGMLSLVNKAVLLHEQIDEAFDKVAGETYKGIRTADYMSNPLKFKEAYNLYDYHVVNTNLDTCPEYLKNIPTNNYTSTIDAALQDSKAFGHNKMPLILINYLSTQKDAYEKELDAQKKANQSYGTYKNVVARAEDIYLTSVEKIDDFLVTPYLSVYANLDIRIRRNLHEALYYTNMLSDNIQKAENLINNIIVPKIAEADADVKAKRQKFESICPEYFKYSSDSSISDAIDNINKVNKLIMSKYNEILKEINDIERDFKILVNTPSIIENSNSDVQFTQFDIKEHEKTISLNETFAIEPVFRDAAGFEVNPTNNAVAYLINSGKDVIKLTENGIVTGVNVGRANILVKPLGLFGTTVHAMITVDDVKITIDDKEVSNSYLIKTTDAKHKVKVETSYSNINSVYIENTNIVKISGTSTHSDDSSDDVTNVKEFEISPVMEGSTYLFINVEGFDTFKILLTVSTIPAKQIYIRTDKSDINVGESTILNVRTVPDDTTDEITWESSDDTIMTVVKSDIDDKAATVTALKSGTVKIIARCGSAYDSIVMIIGEKINAVELETY